MSKRYLSQIITKEKAKEMFTTKGTIQIVNSGTGSGKSYFVLNNILDVAKEDWTLFTKEEWDGKRILLLANRSALVLKLKKELENNLQEREYESDREKGFNHKHFDIYSYQTATKEITEDSAFLNQYDIIICDEIHYCVKDSTFNFSTNLILKALVEHSFNNTVMFFSATDKEIKKALTHISLDFFKGKPLYRDILTKDGTNGLGFKNRLNISVTTEELDTIINSIPVEEKILIFVKEGFSKDKMEDMFEKYSDTEREIGIVYSKWSKGWRNSISEMEDMANKFDLMLEKESFYDEDISMLIANSSIDNGINFCDENLKHIILLEHYDITQSIQKIGRKRHNPHNPNDTTNIYHTIPHVNTVKSKLKTSDRIMDIFEDYKRYSNSFFIKKYHRQLHFNSVYVVGEITAKTDDDFKSKLYNLAVKEMYAMEKLGHKFDNNFPFLKVYYNRDGQLEEHVFMNYCQVMYHFLRQYELKTYLKGIESKKVTASSYFVDRYKENGYTNVSYHSKQTTREKVLELMDERLPMHLKNKIGIEMSRDEYLEERKYCKKTWKVQNKKREVMTSKQFNEFISKYGFTVKSKRRKINGKQIMKYTIGKI